MELYITDVSPYARRPRMAVLEGGLASRVTLRDMSPLAEHRAQVLALGPGGKIPAMVTDDGAVLSETLLITAHLDAASGGLLYPPTRPARWLAMELEGIASVLTDSLVVRRYEALRPDEERSADVLAREAARCRRCYDALEARAGCIAQGDADSLDLGTIAVISALGYASWRFADDNWRAGRGLLAGKLDALANRKSVVSTIPKMD